MDKKKKMIAEIAVGIIIVTGWILIEIKSRTASSEESLSSSYENSVSAEIISPQYSPLSETAVE